MTCLSKLGAERRCNRWARTNMLFLLEIIFAIYNWHFVICNFAAPKNGKVDAPVQKMYFHHH